MATKHYSAEDFQHIPLLGLRLENLAAAPSSPNPGDVYFDTALGYARICTSATGPVWTRLSVTAIVDADIAAGAAIALNKLATDPLARANHTGTQLAATVSDFDTQVRTTRLDQMTAPTSAVGFGGQRATNLADPSGATDAVTRQWLQSYLDTRVNGQDWKASVRVRSGADVTVAAPGATIDTISMVAGDRVLLAGQSDGAENGLWTWNDAATPMTRTSDAATSADVTAGLTVSVEEGGSADSIWLLITNGPIVLGATALTWTQIGGPGAYSAGSGLTLTGNSFALTSPVTVGLGGTGSATAAGARTSLGAALKGFAADVAAMTAGVGLAIAHGLATDDLVVMVRDKTSGAKVGMDVTVDATNITLTSASNVGAAALRVTAATAV